MDFATKVKDSTQRTRSNLLGSDPTPTGKPTKKRHTRLYLESPRPLKNGVITQNDGVSDPFFKGHGDSR